MNQASISIIDFQTQFKTKEDCYNHLFALRWPSGFKCPKCGHAEYFTIKTRKLPLFQCKECKHQTTVIAGTIFEKTRTPLIKWFWTIYLVSHDKRGVSAEFIHREIKVSYPTAWAMLHKIRKAMQERDSNYSLAGIVEMDESFFGAPTEGGKRGRGTEKTKVLVELSLNQKGHPQYVKMKVIQDMKGQTIQGITNSTIAVDSIIYSDNYSSFKSLGQLGYKHQPKKFDRKLNPDHLKWIHTIISNAKALVGGTYHGLNSKHLQYYLNEFCYRFNRRKFVGQWFNRLLFSCLTTSSITYSELTT